MRFFTLLSTYEAIYYAFLFFAAFGFLSFIYCIVKFFWKILNISSGKGSSSEDEAQNRRIKKLEAEVKQLRNLENELDEIKKQVKK